MRLISSPKIPGGHPFPFDSSLLTTSHINTTFEGMVESVVVLNENVLDPSQHSVVTFEENNDPIVVYSDRDTLLIGGSGVKSGLRGRGSDVKIGFARGGWKLNRTMRE